MLPVSSGAPLLNVRNVKMRFGGVIALGGVSFQVGYGQICGLIGPNGSGKTTLFNCISGFYRFTDGDINFEGQSLKGLGRHRMADLGLGRTFQNVALFRNMSVRDNVLVGAHHLGRARGLAWFVFMIAPEQIAGLRIGDHPRAGGDNGRPTEVFFSGTAAEVTHIRSIDRILIADGKIGEITRKIADEFFAIANGLKPDRFGWLTPVNVPASEPVSA